MKQGDVLKIVDRGNLCFVLVMELLRDNTAKVFCLTPCESFPEGFVGYVFPEDNDKIEVCSYKEFLDYQEARNLQKYMTPQTTEIKKGLEKMTNESLEKMTNESLEEQRRKEIEEMVDQALYNRGFGLSLNERMKLFYTMLKGALGGNNDEE